MPLKKRELLGSVVVMSLRRMAESWKLFLMEKYEKTLKTM